MDTAWNKVLDLAPNSSAAWSNRGALRLQYGKWAEAEADLKKAVDLELLQAGSDAKLTAVDASTLNNLGKQS